MLYQIYEAQRTLMEPFAELALVASRLFTNPLAPMSHAPMANRVAAGYNLLHRLAKDYEKPEFGITSVPVDGVSVTIHERVEISKPFCNLLRFKRYADDTKTLETLLRSPVVLVVAPLSGHYSTLLRDTVRTLLRDHKVYITDWKNAREVPLSEGTFSLDDYVNYVQEFIRYLQENNGEVHVVSVCQPTVPVMAAVSLMATRGEKTPASMTMMGGPIDASRSPTAVNDLAIKRSLAWFETNVIHRVPNNYPGAGRRVYPGFLQYAGFVAMNPNRHATSYYDYFKDLVRGDGGSTESHRKFYDEYNAVLDMDAEFYLDTIKTVFQDYALPNGTWEVRNPEGTPELVRPQDITKTAVLAIEGELDDIAGLGQTQASLDLCSSVPESEKQYFEVMGAGHYGIFSGRRWREVVYPILRDFIARHHTGIVTTKRRAASQALMEALENREDLYEQLQLGNNYQPVEDAPATSQAKATTPAVAAAAPAAKAPAARKPATTRAKPAATRKPAASKTAAAAKATAAKPATAAQPAEAAKAESKPAVAASKPATSSQPKAAATTQAAAAPQAASKTPAASAPAKTEAASNSTPAAAPEAEASRPVTAWRTPETADGAQPVKQEASASKQP
ncbi:MULTISPECIES: polyhydroxyalkanoate depolymerase [Brachymonas]|uniref:polyhydroxyalkanoate depolymerase n=1 Tax=Brachymonas TaxID=28219 RepID=UPI00168F2E52|nr:polyhydroxyalkanoate depolymerase [Brachymonas sp. J145]MEE1653236.1 polyhydroxyalkanoate depolymerase [Brachymonas sp. J145]NLX15934.1 polyhydroxyalkanoate depolymerase [Ramlibacter sp.]